jgi:hypothetical protein
MRLVMNRTGTFACAVVVFAVAAAAGATGLLPGKAAATTSVSNTNFPCNTPTPCVNAINSAGGAGVKGSSKTGIGVLGTTNKAFAVEGVSGTGATGGVEGIGTSGYGLYGKSSTGVGTYGQSSSGFGLKAISATNDALYAANTNLGSAIEAVASHGNAIHATTANGIGLSATVTAGIGAFITGPTGIIVQSPVAGGNPIDVIDDTNRTTFFLNGVGNVTSGATSGTGIDSSTASGTGAYLHSGNGLGAKIVGTNDNGADITGAAYGVVARAPAGSSGDPFVATDTSANILFYVDGSGNVFYHGSLIQFAKTRGGQQAMGFGSTATTPSLEDVGSAQLVNGQAVVRLNSTFAQVIDLREPYHVFLTPDGDTKGLYVASKSADGFVVRETQNGRGTFAFDYRIVATALGRAGERMALVSRSLEPKAPLVRPHAIPPPNVLVPHDGGSH